MELRPYQTACVNDAVAFLSDPPTPRRMYRAPTGTGKSLMQLGVKQALPDLTIVSPNDDILRGFARKIGSKAVSKPGLEKLGLYTPIRLRNLLLKGDIPKPRYLCLDEAHHHESNTFELLDALSDECPTIGFTATPFRGSAKATLSLRKKWGDPVEVISMPEAVKEGYMSFPECRIVPMMDDDVIEVKNGEFVAQSVERQCYCVVERVIELINNLPRRPTMLAMPTVNAAKLFTERLCCAGIPAICVTGDSTTTEREYAFAACLSGDAVLVQVRVVSEGVDLAIRRLIDLSPMMSPVQWLQQFGRITRPGENGEYICCNRNLLRHAYLLQGLLPPAIYRLGEQAFGCPSTRSQVRTLGFESLGKFKPSDIPLYNGTKGQLVCISKADPSGVVHEYAAIASPLHENVVYAERVNVRGPDGTKRGKWHEIDEIPDLETGFASVFKGELSPAQTSWWVNSARWYGLDPEANVDTRTFTALPILKDTGNRFR